VGIDVVVVTGQNMPIEDAEGPVILERLCGRGVAAEIRTWGSDLSDARLAVVRSTWDYVDRRGEFLDWLGAVGRTSRVVNPPSVIEWNSHKQYLLELASAGVPVVPTEVVRAGAPAAVQRAAVITAGERVVAKPAVGAGARGAIRSRFDEPLLAQHLQRLVDQGDALVQPYVETIGTSGETSLVYFRGELSHAVRKLPGAGDYRIHEHLGGSTSPHEPDAAELDVAGRALAQVGTTSALTYARVDLVQLPDGPAVMELELIEPFLFLAYAPGAVDRFADALVAQLADG
jgi:glutathione synthase/RimK-type ligase-like ATP-grasp enzyme